MQADFTVLIDRSLGSILPVGSMLMHPELELSGPSKYDLRKVKLWLHEHQKTGTVSGDTIYNHLKVTNALESCLGLKDGLAIKEKGLAVFLAAFGRKKVVFLWRTVITNDQGQLSVPCLMEYEYGLQLDWYWFSFHWDAESPALRF